MHVECPFCGFTVHWGLPGSPTPYRWCSGCYTEFTVSESGRTVMFDTELKTPRFAWAKAIAKSGGATIGPTPDGGR